MTHRSLLWAACTLLSGCASLPAPDLDFEVRPRAPLVVRWDGVRANLTAEEGMPVTARQAGEALLLSWAGHYLWLREQGGRVQVRRVVGVHSWPDPEDWPTEPVGSGSFLAGVSLRLEEGGEVSVLSSASKADAVPPGEAKVPPPPTRR